jgi:hypothetical protein
MIERKPDRRKREPTFQETALVASVQKLERERDELLTHIRAFGNAVSAMIGVIQYHGHISNKDDRVEHVIDGMHAADRLLCRYPQPVPGRDAEQLDIVK